MQDDRTGQMVPLDDVFAKMETRNFEDTISSLMRDESKVQLAGEQAGIPAEHQGLVLSVGDIVTVKEHQFHRSRKFEVRGFEGGLLHLQGVPENAN